MFGMGRKDGGPSWYEDNLPEILRDRTGRIIAIVCGLLILLGGVFVLLGFLSKKKKIITALKFLMCSSSGVILLPTVMNHSWAEAHRSIITQTGPLEVPTKLKIGVKGGIWNVDIYIEAPGIVHPELSVIEELNLANREIMYRQHILALRKGWSWPLLLMTSFLGGEKPVWEGLLGTSLYKASFMTKPCIYGVGYLWILWCISFSVAPKSAPIMMMVLGFSKMVTAGIYSLVIFSTCPRVILTDGESLTLNIGWSVKLIAGFGLCFFILGLMIHRAWEPVAKKRVCRMIIKDSTVTPTIELRIPQNMDGKITLNATSLIYPNKDGTQKHISPTVMSQMFVL